MTGGTIMDKYTSDSKISNIRVMGNEQTKGNFGKEIGRASCRERV